MKKIICGTEYDTEASSVVKKYTVGSFGDPEGFEETLYSTAEGKLFLYTNGGEDSDYPGIIMWDSTGGISFLTKTGKGRMSFFI